MDLKYQSDPQLIVEFAYPLAKFPGWCIPEDRQVGQVGKGVLWSLGTSMLLSCPLPLVLED